MRAEGLIGTVRKGCDIMSPPNYWARLRPPVRGTATFRGNTPRSPLRSLWLEGGVVTDRGVKVGSPAAAVRRVYPRAQVVNTRPGDPLQFSAITIVRKGKWRMWFLLDQPGGRVEAISVPGPEFCE